MPVAVALFFLLFLAPAMGLALLAARDFALRGAPADARRMRRARLLLALSGALDLALVLLTTLATQGAPLVALRGLAFLAFGPVALGLALLGTWLFTRAVADPRKALRKAAETLPFVLIVLDLSLAAAAAR
ncbi:MAG: hypothetical protein LC624_02400 [Halobacteriales archaeon]|nr:hypothetical protein [Halobacteriales archaeon]